MSTRDNDTQKVIRPVALKNKISLHQEQLTYNRSCSEQALHAAGWVSPDSGGDGDETSGSCAISSMSGKLV